MNKVHNVEFQIDQDELVVRVICKGCKLFYCNNTVSNNTVNGISVGFAIPIAEAEQMQEGAYKTFDQYCDFFKELGICPEDVLPLEDERNCSNNAPGKVMFLYTSSKPELFDQDGKRILDLPRLWHPVNADISFDLDLCYNKAHDNYYIWRELVSVKICEMPTKRRLFIPCDPEKENRGVTDDLETID